MMELDVSEAPPSGSIKNLAREKSALSSRSQLAACGQFLDEPLVACASVQWEAVGRRSSSNVSLASTKSQSKGKRTLPSMPGACTARDLEKRRQRLAQRVLRRVQKGAVRRPEGESADTVVVRLAPTETTSPAGDLSDTERTPGDDAVDARLENGLGQEEESPPRWDTPQRPAKYSGQQLAANYDDGPLATSPELWSADTRHQGHGSGSSKDALQRVINDLRNASNKPVKKRASYSTSQTTSQTTSHDSWGSPQPAVESPVADFDSPSPPTAVGSIQADIDSYLQLAGSLTAALKESSHDTRRQHPSLHQVVSVCELHSVLLHNTTGQNVDAYGIEVFESLFCETDARARGVSTFRSPEGRRPLIGRTRGAFIPVTSCLAEQESILSLNAVDYIEDNSVALQCARIQDGDYLVEVGV